MTLHTEKYKQAILYLCAKLGKEVRGKKKLAKLLYFVDFDFLKKTRNILLATNTEHCLWDLPHFFE